MKTTDEYVDFPTFARRLARMAERSKHPFHYWIPFGSKRWVVVVCWRRVGMKRGERSS